MRASDGMSVQKYDIPTTGGGFEARHWSPVNVPVLDARGNLTAIIHHVEDVSDYVWTRRRAAELDEVSQRLEAEVLAAAARLRRADQALLESEARFRNMADHAPVMMWITDPTGSCIYLNRRWYEFTGQSHEEAEGFGWLDVTHPEDRRAADEAFRAANADRDPFRIEYRLRRADGVYRWAIDAASPRFSESGEFLGYVGSVIDIDERREMEDRLRRKEERLRLATEHAEIGFWDLDLVHDTLLWPPVVRRMFGISSEAPVTMSDFYTGLHPEDRDATAAALGVATDPAVRGLYDVEYRTVGRDDGVVRWVAAKGRGLFDADGHCVRMVGTAIDVTQRKIVEQHLLLMVHELNHRVKNTLATVQAIIAQTLRGGDVPCLVREALTERLMALSRAHDVLTEQRWSGADLREIATVASEPYLGDGPSPFVIDGPSITLPPRMAIAMALAFHELATNAAKYGALSRQGGQVAITWWAEPQGEAQRLDLEWRESGGPLVRPPAKQGFGTRLIQRSLAPDLGGEVDLAFAPDGLVCRLSCLVMEEPKTEGVIDTGR
jgi:PAS domain S-box-containing protein